MKLTEKQKTKIITEYMTESVSQRELAKRYHVTQKTISTILSSDKARQMVSKAENDTLLSMSAFISSKKAIAQELINLALESAKDKIKKASFKDTINAIEKLSTIFREGDNNSQDEKESAVTIIFQDCRDVKEDE